MKTKTPIAGGSATFLAATNRFMPQVMFDAEKGSGSGDDSGKTDDTNKNDDAAAAEAAAAAAAAAAEAAKGKDKPDDADKQALLREVMDKKGKIQSLTGEVDGLKNQLKAFEGIDPVKVRELLQKETENERKEAEAKGDFERVKAMIVEEHGKEKGTLTTRISELETQLQAQNEIIDGLTVGNDFASSSYIKEQLTLSPTKARKLYGAHFEVREGKTVAFDKPAGSKDRTELTGADGKPLGFDLAFKKIVEADPDKDLLIRATAKPGSGSRNNGEKTVEKPKTTPVKGIDRLRGSIDDLLA